MSVNKYIDYTFAAFLTAALVGVTVGICAGLYAFVRFVVLA